MFNFSRRINGLTYYTGVAISLLVAVSASLLAELPTTGTFTGILVGLVVIFAALALFVYWVCLMRQRANDIGWHPLLLTVLAFGTPLFLVLGLIPGQPAQNKFGSKPYKGISLL